MESSRKEKESRDKIYARMATLDLISFNVLAHSIDIKLGLRARNIEPFNSHASGMVPMKEVKNIFMKKNILFSVATAVKRYAEHVKREIKTWLAEKKKEGERFSATTDEWTDLMVRRFGCVNIHLPGGQPMAQTRHCPPSPSPSPFPPPPFPVFPVTE